jgi:D-alanine-D-alanine ligase
MDATTTKRRRTALATSSKRVLDITVLCGGPSAEREVSLLSGRSITQALGSLGHKVTSADINPDDVSALDRKGMEVVFIALHGTFGENGEVQQLCDDRHLPYVGSGPKASAIAMDKVASKELFRRSGLNTPDWVVIDSGMSEGQRRDMLAEVPPPCVVKPIASGSSVDVIICPDAATCDAARGKLLGAYGSLMVESFIAGREFTVGVLAEEALPIIEIKTGRSFYDYFAKYEDDATQYIVNPELPALMDKTLKASALAAHRALGCRDFSRVDFMLSRDGVLHVLESNTIPGFTSHSLLPKAAAAAGIPMAQLCERLVRLALARQA